MTTLRVLTLTLLIAIVCLLAMTQKKVCYDKQTMMTTRFNDSKRIYATRSPFQTIEVYDTKTFGRILAIDGDVQLSASDEANYHEMIVHVPFAYMPSPKHALIVGGGDGGTLREIVKYRSLTAITMVEIDSKVVETAKRFFPKLASGFYDPRVSLIIQDAIEYVERCPDDYYDVIVMDVTDFNHSEGLFTQETVRHLRRVLRDDGIMTLNFQSLGIGGDHPQVVLKRSNIAIPFVHSFLFQSFQPTFAGGHYTFAFLSDVHDPTIFPTSWHYDTLPLSTEYYTPDVHIGSFALPAKFAPSIRTLNTGEAIIKPGPLGVHILIDVMNCTKATPENVDALCTSLVRLSESTELKRMSHTFEPQGYTTAVLLAESHIACHTWPERSQACIDLFTCKRKDLPVQAIALEIEAYLGGACTLHRTMRGTES